MRDEHVRRIVAHVMGILSGVGGAVDQRRWRHRGEAPQMRRALRRDVAPMLAAVARQLNQPVVGSHPNLATRTRRALDVEDGVAVLGARHVVSDRSARRNLMFFAVQLRPRSVVWKITLPPIQPITLPSELRHGANAIGDSQLKRYLLVARCHDSLPVCR